MRNIKVFHSTRYAFRHSSVRICGRSQEVASAAPAFAAERLIMPVGAFMQHLHIHSFIIMMYL